MPLPTLTEALMHLRAYRATFDPGGMVDETSGLTADDLDTIVAACTETPEDRVIDQLGDLA